MLTNKQILQRAQNLIRDPFYWCRFTAAETPGGRDVMPLDPKAVRFCAYGAVSRVRGYDMVSWHEADDLLSASAVALDPECCGAGVFNDRHSHADVMRMFDHAISKA